VRAAWVLPLVCAAIVACGGPAAVGSPTPTPTPTPSPTQSPTPSPTASVVRPTIEPTTLPLPSFASISAPSPSVAWIVVGGRLLFRSTDKGDTWQQRPLPAATNAQLSFVSDQEGWVALAATAPQCQGDGITLWHTTDGGTSWQQQTMTGLADGRCKQNLSFVDATHGFVGTFDATSAVIYRTGDGGRTWAASAPLPNPPGAAGPSLRPQLVRAYAATSLVPVLNTGQAAFVYRSGDAGATWQFATAGPMAGNPIALVTASRWLQIVPPSSSQETTDGGATWHAYTTDYSQAAPIAPDIVFADATTGYATVRGGLQRTIDGGAHWTTLKTPGTG
jgi:photosystem II stability/assembly factor-like uncharacterized protein